VARPGRNTGRAMNRGTLMASPRGLGEVGEHGMAETETGQNVGGLRESRRPGIQAPTGECRRTGNAIPEQSENAIVLRARETGVQGERRARFQASNGPLVQQPRGA